MVKPSYLAVVANDSMCTVCLQSLWQADVLSTHMWIHSTVSNLVMSECHNCDIFRIVCLWNNGSSALQATWGRAAGLCQLVLFL